VPLDTLAAQAWLDEPQAQQQLTRPLPTASFIRSEVRMVSPDRW
jgi:hypothetical protein